MKKKKSKETQSKEFASKPMAGVLKGFRAHSATQPPQAKPMPLSAEQEREADLFTRTVGDVRRLKGEPAPDVPADDAELFLRSVAGARRFDKTEQASGVKVPASGASRAQDEEERAFFLKAVENLRLDVTFRDHLPEEEAPDLPLPVNRLRQLKRGAIRLDLELDLHGLTRDEATANLAYFIEKAHQRGVNAVLVITGKGNRSASEPVLLNAVTGWLRERGKGVVAEFAPAPRELGGGGALVVFLKGKGKEKSGGDGM